MFGGLIGWLVACRLSGKRRTQLGETPMCYVGLDISLSTASVCVVDKDGSVLCESVVAAEVADIAKFLEVLPAAPVRVGLEAGPFSEWITAGLIERGFTALSLECRQVKAALSAMPVKTDRNDA